MMMVSNHVQRLEKIGSICRSCVACELHKTRTRVVVGEGNPDSVIMFVGEGPGKEEDLTGRPFVGKSGQLLRKMIRAIGLDPEKDCFIANIVKCRPPNNRPPESNEIENCIKFLKKQIEVISPSVIVLLGKTAVKGLLPDIADQSMYNLRQMKNVTYDGIKVMITYHPSALLRDPRWHKDAIEDFKKIEKEYSNASFIQKTIEGETSYIMQEIPF